MQQGGFPRPAQMPREGNRNERDERKAYEPQEHEKKEPCPSREPVMGSQPIVSVGRPAASYKSVISSNPARMAS
jgi:hypothetical protein